MVQAVTAGMVPYAQRHSSDLPVRHGARTGRLVLSGLGEHRTTVSHSCKVGMCLFQQSQTKGSWALGPQGLSSPPPVSTQQYRKLAN